jgi:hypothetical protein
MARPHIEFVQAQNVAWEDCKVRPGARMKHLSEDPDTGALSAIIQYPPGWQAPAAMLDMDEEFFVLDGALDHGGTGYSADCYAFWPRFFPRRVLSSPGGATVLTFLSGRPRDTTGNFDAARLTERINIREGEWKADLAGMGLEVMASFAKLRRLRSDPGTGEITYVTACMPFWTESQPERHPVIQEFFVLAGETAGPLGIMRPGAYTWRPENTTHGPYGSTTGAVFFFRSHGGPQRTEHDPPTPFRFDPPHRPVVPAGMEAAAAPVPTAVRY